VSDGSQPDDRQNAVGFALVAGITGLDGYDPLPGFLATLSVELFGLHSHVLAGHLDPNLIGMRRDVVIPARVVCRAGCRCNDQVYAVLTAAGHGAIEQARAIYLDVLRKTLGAHLNSAELSELGRITDKLLDALDGDSPRCWPDAPD
jgi:hypothetical protein